MPSMRCRKCCSPGRIILLDLPIRAVPEYERPDKLPALPPQHVCTGKRLGRMHNMPGQLKDERYGRCILCSVRVRRGTGS